MKDVRELASRAQGEAVEFLRDLIRIPSPSGDEARVVEAIAQRMREGGFDEVLIDPFGNVLGRIGRGRRAIAFDAHVDTVGVGDPGLWTVDPFEGVLRDGIVYGRGASDQKGGMAALVYAGRILKEIGLGGDLTVWIVGSVLEEDCDGLCWNYILTEKEIEPEVVVLTEPTNLHVYRGHRGRMEIEITTRGISCHGSAPERGVNAIHRMAPILGGVERLNARLASDPFLGKGSVTVSEIRSTAPSLCAVADSCSIHLDRRLTLGETEQVAISEIEEIVAGMREGGAIEVEIPQFTRPSHTGLVYPMRQYFPAWALPADSPHVELALKARRLALGEEGDAGRWIFSTNGVATMGLHRVPTIGFGPASEVHAHAPTDQCPAADIGAAIAFYAQFALLCAGDRP